MNTFDVPAWEFYGWKPEKLGFPERWTVKEQKMIGHDSPKLSDREFAEKLQNPVGTPQLSDLAKGKQRCVIVIDDMTRPTKQYQMLPAVLNELHKGGLNDDQIVFMMATGAHGGRLLFDFQKKLGPETPKRYLVFNHNCYENLVDLGETSHGTPIHINTEVMNCDLKITLGVMMPHFGYGFGGGSKMILPGVAGIDSITHNHRIRDGTGPGKVLENVRRLDSEEAARAAGVDFVINAFMNADCDVADLVCGDVVDAHREGVKIARRHYATEIVKDADIVIGNGYPMANEGYKAYHLLNDSVREGGDMVFLLYTPEGCRVHHYNGRFGTDFGGRGWTKTTYIKKPWKMNRVICVTPQIAKMDEYYYGEGSQWVKSWQKARKMLEETHSDDALVALYPTAAMQISKANASNT
ncbi:MAG: lactate racemase domain-containing protein [Candidatus Bathyarchaeota archaeon]|nr:lactate racemase domain-containing protein [Candidatus Bathyarchaeota archaeon]